MHMYIPRAVKLKDGATRIDHCRLEIREQKAGVLLIVDHDDDGLGLKKVAMSISEASKLSDLLNAVRRKVVERAEWRP